VEGLVRTWDKAPDGRRVDIVPEIMRLVLEIAGATLFGADMAGEADDLGAAQRDIFALVRHKMDKPLSAPLWMPTRRNRAYHRAKRLLDGVVFRIIESRQRSGLAGNDLLHLLLAARDEESGTGMSAPQLRDEVLTLLFAGHDTTAA